MTQMVARWNTLTYHTFRICYAVLWHLSFVIGLEIQMKKKNWISNFMFYKNLIVNVFFSLSESIFQSFHFLFRTTLSILITSMSLLLKAIQDCIRNISKLNGSVAMRPNTSPTPGSAHQCRAVLLCCHTNSLHSHPSQLANLLPWDSE